MIECGVVSVVEGCSNLSAATAARQSVVPHRPGAVSAPAVCRRLTPRLAPGYAGIAAPQPPNTVSWIGDTVSITLPMQPKSEFLTLTFAIHVKVRFVTVTKFLDKVILLL